MTETRVQRAFRVTGLVQGVGFRWFTRHTAARLGLAGWVANDADGAVSGVVAGDTARVDEFVRALRHGPPGARVTTLTLDDATGHIAASASAFDIRA